MKAFFIFVAPFLVLFASMILGFWLALNDQNLEQDEK
ncbi:MULTISPECIES: cytochrome bd oxidase small subunit CydS [Pallidibacillus]